jgi:hypothetical protein
MKPKTGDNDVQLYIIWMYNKNEIKSQKENGVVENNW